MFKKTLLQTLGNIFNLTQYNAIEKLLKDGLVVKLSSKTYQGGMIFSGFSTMYSEYP